jgi:hypothetical protein
MYTILSQVHPDYTIDLDDQLLQNCNKFCHGIDTAVTYITS